MIAKVLCNGEPLLPLLHKKSKYKKIVNDQSIKPMKIQKKIGTTIQPGRKIWENSTKKLGNKDILIFLCEKSAN